MKARPANRSPNNNTVVRTLRYYRCMLREYCTDEPFTLVSQQTSACKSTISLCLQDGHVVATSLHKRRHSDSNNLVVCNGLEKFSVTQLMGTTNGSTGTCSSLGFTTSWCITYRSLRLMFVQAIVTVAY